MNSTDIRDEEQPIDVKGLTRQFGKTTALKNVDLSVSKGRVLGLVGENGAGKTTLIKHLMGLLKVQEGESACIRHRSGQGPGGCAEQDWISFRRERLAALDACKRTDELHKGLLLRLGYGIRGGIMQHIQD